MKTDTALKIKSKRNFAWIKVLFWALIAFISIQAGNVKIQKNSYHLPDFEELTHISSVVKYSEKVVGARNSYLKICLTDTARCFKYKSGLPGWRNAQKVFVEGNNVEIWAWGGSPMFIWQFKHNGKIIESYKMVKWHIENVRKVQQPIGYGFMLLGIFCIFIGVGVFYKLLFVKEYTT